MDNSIPEMSEKLVQYLDGELKGSEKERMEQLLATDTGLQGDFESLKQSRAAVQLYGLKERVSGIHSLMIEEFKTPVRKISPVRKIIRYTIAVAASIIIGISGLFAFYFFSLSGDKLFSSNYRSYQLSVVRGTGEDNLSTLEEFYTGKEYNKVVSITYNRPFTIKENFLRAMSFVELNKDSLAGVEFKKVISQNDISNSNILKDEAEYYLALTYIRKKDFGLALNILQKIRQDPGHLFHDSVSPTLFWKVKILAWR